MYKPDKDTQKLKELIDDEFKVKGYIRYPFVESFLKELKQEALDKGRKEFAMTVFKELEIIYGKEPARDFFKKLSASLRTPLSLIKKDQAEI